LCGNAPSQAKKRRKRKVEVGFCSQWSYGSVTKDRRSREGRGCARTNREDRLIGRGGGGDKRTNGLMPNFSSVRHQPSRKGRSPLIPRFVRLEKEREREEGAFTDSGGPGLTNETTLRSKSRGNILQRQMRELDDKRKPTLGRLGHQTGDLAGRKRMTELLVG